MGLAGSIISKGAIGIEAHLIADEEVEDLNFGCYRTPIIKITPPGHNDELASARKCAVISIGRALYGPQKTSCGA